MANEPAPRPNWLDDDFLRTCVLNSKGLPKDTDVDISDVKLTYVVAKGENYMSLMYRVTLDYHIADGAKANGVQNGRKTESDTFVVKVSHEMEHLKAMAKESKIFLKEVDMYVNVMPKFTKLLNNSGVNGDLACRCIHSIEGDRDALVMEDLKLKGYLLADRLKGLDLAHTKLVIDKLARLHAASMKDLETNPIPELYSSPPFEKISSDEKAQQMMKMFEETTKTKINAVVSELNKYDKYAKQIDFYRKYEKLGFVNTQKIWSRIKGNKFNALNHGDCWVNNLMFKYNEDGSVEQVLFIDLQISYYTSVGNDFLYFFFSSTNDDVKRNHFIDVQKYYIERLALYLKKLNYAGDIPTYEDFDKELRRLFLISIHIITVFNSIILQEFNEEQKDRSKSVAFEMEDVIKIASNVTKSYTRVLLLSIDVLEENGFYDSFSFSDFKNNNNKVD